LQHSIKHQDVCEIVGEGIGTEVRRVVIGSVAVPRVVTARVEPRVPNSLPKTPRDTIVKRLRPIAVAVIEIVKRRVFLEPFEVGRPIKIEIRVVEVVTRTFTLSPFASPAMLTVPRSTDLIAVGTKLSRKLTDGSVARPSPQQATQTTRARAMRILRCRFIKSLFYFAIFSLVSVLGV